MVADIQWLVDKVSGIVRDTSGGRVAVQIQSFDGAEHKMRAGKDRPVTMDQLAAECHGAATAKFDADVAARVRGHAML